MVYRYISDLVCVRYNSVCITCRVPFVELNVFFILCNFCNTDEAKPGINIILLVFFFGWVDLKPVYD